jgi:hypothetical protein
MKRTKTNYINIRTNFCVYEAWVLHFRKSTGIGYRYAYGNPWVRTDSVHIFLFFILQRVHTWYSCGTHVVLLWYTNPKKCNFFSFSFIHFFFVYRKIYAFYLFNIKVATLLINNNKVVVGLFTHSLERNRLNLILFIQILMY